jgi:hypothetical protein
MTVYHGLHGLLNSASNQRYQGVQPFCFERAVSAHVDLKINSSSRQPRDIKQSVERLQHSMQASLNATRLRLNPFDRHGSTGRRAVPFCLRDPFDHARQATAMRRDLPHTPSARAAERASGRKSQCLLVTIATRRSANARLGWHPMVKSADIPSAVERAASRPVRN